MSVRVGLIGDRDENVTAHRAIPIALQMVEAESVWVPTDAVAALDTFDALWCVPASPYRSMEGALSAIRFARENGVPFLGSCGGFQHAVLEYARNVLGWQDADHAESAPDATRLVVSPLACALVEESETLRLASGSRIADAYGTTEIREEYRCRFGLNPAFAAELTTGPLRAAAFDPTGEVRAVELEGHPFFVATLFQSERAALRGSIPPLARSLVASAAKRRSEIS